MLSPEGVLHPAMGGALRGGETLTRLILFARFLDVSDGHHVRCSGIRTMGEVLRPAVRLGVDARVQQRL